MSEGEEYHDSHVGEADSEGEEVFFKTTTATSSTTLITRSDREEIIEGWKEKFRKITDGMRPTPVRPFATPCAPKMSTPITPSGVHSRYRSDFPFTSPVNQDAPTGLTRGSVDYDLSQRPTHEDEHGNSGDSQHPPVNNNSGMNNSASRPSSSPRVPIFDGTVSAQFRPWIIQFEAIARHQCWTMGERVVRLVASLTGPAANMLIGMTMGQLDDYAFLVARLSRRYDPPEREEAHSAELCVRTRRRNETADEFAENLKNLAQHAYTNSRACLITLWSSDSSTGLDRCVCTLQNARRAGNTRLQIQRGTIHSEG